MNVGAAKFKPGDLVDMGPELPNDLLLAIVVSVQRSDQVPDAKQRGLEDVYPWRYWTFDGSRVLGPMSEAHLTHVD